LKHDRRWFGVVVCAVNLLTGLLATGCEDDSKIICVESTYGDVACASGHDSEDASETSGDSSETGGDSSETSEGYSRGTCSGTPSICAAFGSYNCSNQPGCSWSYSRRICSGFAWSCRSATTEGTCRTIRGCHWRRD
jgi:hypothetical protein